MIGRLDVFALVLRQGRANRNPRLPRSRRFHILSITAEKGEGSRAPPPPAFDPSAVPPRWRSFRALLPSPVPAAAQGQSSSCLVWSELQKKLVRIWNPLDRLRAALEPTLEPCRCGLDRCRDVSRQSISVLKHFSPTGGRRKRKLKEDTPPGGGA